VDLPQRLKFGKTHTNTTNLHSLGDDILEVRFLPLFIGPLSLFLEDRKRSGFRVRSHPVGAIEAPENFLSEKYRVPIGKNFSTPLLFPALIRHNPVLYRQSTLSEIPPHILASRAHSVSSPRCCWILTFAVTPTLRDFRSEFD